MNRNSIRQKLLRASLLIVAALMLSSGAFLAVNLWVTQQYKAISDNLTAEYRLADSASKLIAAYNTRVRSSNTNSTGGAEVELAAAKENIQELTVQLDAAVVDPQSISSYTGLKNTISAVVAEVDAGLASLKGNDLAASSAHYEEANNKYEFVKDTSTALFIDELKYANSARERLDTAYRASVVINLFALLVIGLGCVAYLLSFSNKLAAPLRRLAAVAEKVAAGDTGAVIDDPLRAGDDEIGSLARSLNTMLLILFKNISTLDASNKAIAESSHVLESKNSELERLNTLMIDRELKMIELKKQNEALKIQLKGKL
jgi:nitrogen fixation/metabolism regulation signal transduction histidine kinase